MIFEKQVFLTFPFFSKCLNYFAGRILGREIVCEFPTSLHKLNKFSTESNFGNGVNQIPNYFTNSQPAREPCYILIIYLGTIIYLLTVLCRSHSILNIHIYMSLIYVKVMRMLANPRYFNIQHASL